MKTHPTEKISAFGNATSAKVIRHTLTQKNQPQLTLTRLLSIKVNRLTRSGGKLHRLRGQVDIFLPNPKDGTQHDPKKAARQAQHLENLAIALRGLGVRTVQVDEEAMHVIRRDPFQDFLSMSEADKKKHIAKHGKPHPSDARFPVSAKFSKPKGAK